MNVKRSNQPFTQGVTITPSDTVDIAAGPTRAVYVGGAGNVRAIMGGAAVNFLAVPVGTLLHISATRINVAGTTATNLVALN